MTKLAPVNDEEVPEAPPIAPDRRVWGRRNGLTQGSLGVSLKVFAVLYDAGRPLTRDELASAFVERLDPVDGSYIEAWHLHRLRQLTAERRRRGQPERVELSSTLTDRPSAARAWLSHVFLKRIQKGKGETLIRDAEGRYAPGPRAPRIHTMDGRLLEYTPTVRHELAQEDHDNSRTHIALLEWKRLRVQPAFATREGRAQVLIFLLRRLLVTPTTARLDERTLAGLFGHLLRVTDTPGATRNVLQGVWDDLVESL